jgi:hypothetical protein
LCSKLRMSLDCLHPVSCVPKVTDVSGLSSSCVLCAQSYGCLWIVFILCLVCPKLRMSLDCLRPVSCVPKVTDVSGLSSSCVLCAQSYGCLWIVQSWLPLLVFLMFVIFCLQHRRSVIIFEGLSRKQ